MGRFAVLVAFLAIVGCGCTGRRAPTALTAQPHPHYCTGSATGDAHARLWSSSSRYYGSLGLLGCTDRTGNTYFQLGRTWYYQVETNTG
jgi:hypothetical protein